MNELKFEIRVSNEDYAAYGRLSSDDVSGYAFLDEFIQEETKHIGSIEVYPIVDGADIIHDGDDIALLAQDFFKQDFYTTDKPLLLGICGCGCLGCDDYYVEVSLQDNMVVWKDWHTDSEYCFDRLQYENALETTKRSCKEKQLLLYKKRERKAEKIVSKLLKGTKIGSRFCFKWVHASVKEQQIKVFYFDKIQTEQKTYVINWDGSKDYNYFTESWSYDTLVTSVKAFIRETVQKEEYLLDWTLKTTYNFVHDSSLVCKRSYCMSKFVLTALNCNDKYAKVVALLWGTEFSIVDKYNYLTIECLVERRYPHEIIEAVECLLNTELHTRNPRKIESYDDFIKRVVKNPIARQVAITAYRIKKKLGIDMLNKAFNIAYTAHAGQTDKAGAPYILHPIRVALHCNTEEEKIVALLHDVVEDTPTTLEDLRKAGFTAEIVDAVKCLTKTKGEEYQGFIQRVATNKIATQVKIRDLKDNMDISRLGNKPHWKIDTYKEALEFLQKAAK